jgi:hypothetical protein
MIASDDLQELATIFGELAVTPNGIAQREQLERVQQAFSRMAARSRTQAITGFDSQTDRDREVPIPVPGQTVLIRSIIAIQEWDGSAWVTIIT